MEQADQPSSRATFITAVLCAVAFLAVYGALNSYQVSAEYARQYPDAYGGERARVRFASLAAKVPVTTELGYFTDLDPAQSAYAPAFLSAQYALAPRSLTVIDEKNKPELALGNFTKPQDFAAAGEARGYVIDTDLGNGVILYRRKAS